MITSGHTGHTGHVDQTCPFFLHFLQGSPSIPATKVTNLQGVLQWGYIFHMSVLYPPWAP